jgi:hypothetical protein
MFSQRWLWRSVFSEMQLSVFCILRWLLACLASFSTSKIEVIYYSPRSLWFFHFWEFYCVFWIRKPRAEESEFTLSLSLTHTHTHTQVLCFFRNGREKNKMGKHIKSGRSQCKGRTNLFPALTYAHTRTEAQTHTHTHTHTHIYTHTHTYIHKHIHIYKWFGMACTYAVDMKWPIIFSPTLSRHALEHMWKPVMIQANSECEDRSSPLRMTARTQ